MGIVLHLGPSIAQEHYISYFRAGQNWMKANDETVTAVRWQTVVSKKAYILFYEQIYPPETKHSFSTKKKQQM